MQTFDMRQLLDAFDGDPDKLAEAFTRELNEQIQKDRKEQEIKTASATVAYDWNQFVSLYCAVHKLVPDKYYIEDGDAIALFEMILKVLPTFEQINNIIPEVKGKTEDVIASFLETMGW